MSEFDIKKILDMLDWNALKDVQKQGIQQAKIKTLSQLGRMVIELQNYKNITNTLNRDLHNRSGMVAVV